MIGNDSCKYIQDRVQQHYLEVIPSRWRAVLSRLAKNTQKLQKCESKYEKNLLIDIMADFDLINTILDEEHQIYHDGLIFLATDIQDEKIEKNDLNAAKHLLQGILSSIAIKEVIITHWKNSLINIPSDTLRVYCHACISHPHLSLNDVEKVRALFVT